MNELFFMTFVLLAGLSTQFASLSKFCFGELRLMLHIQGVPF